MASHCVILSMISLIIFLPKRHHFLKTKWNQRMKTSHLAGCLIELKKSFKFVIPIGKSEKGTEGKLTINKTTRTIWNSRVQFSEQNTRTTSITTSTTISSWDHRLRGWHIGCLVFDGSFGNCIEECSNTFIIFGGNNKCLIYLVWVL